MYVLLIKTSSTFLKTVEEVIFKFIFSFKTNWITVVAVEKNTIHIRGQLNFQPIYSLFLFIIVCFL